MPAQPTSLESRNRENGAGSCGDSNSDTIGWRYWWGGALIIARRRFSRNSILKFPTKVSLDYNYLRLIASFDAARLCSRNESIRVHPNSALFESIHAR